MNWYIAKLIFKVSTSSVMTQFDEHLRLIQADDLEDAVFKARLLGITEEDQFFNEKKSLVSWEFVNVSDVRLLEELAHGAELYSCIYETSEGRRYIRDVHQRAQALQAKMTIIG
ncbi:MAG: DUF4288 domain-containing protein [Cyclobacteriaceae bacterium]|jgi:hypothetical protein|nr:DUF4288 domain-containing protein [Cytophagales bacterium]HNP75832.1 DUF4288 domain-containing protein [Cyclobacteriaceae bacterium]HQQ81815.1 DUF4288 domain-containing protein [Cyclobacteriaceae bacterium]